MGTPPRKDGLPLLKSQMDTLNVHLTFQFTQNLIAVSEQHVQKLRWLTKWLRYRCARRSALFNHTAYDKPCGDMSQQCYAHIMRRFERLLKKEPENRERRAFVPKMCALLSEAMKLRTKGLSPEDFVREVMQSVMESLALLYDNPAAPLSTIGVSAHAVH